MGCTGASKYAQASETESALSKQEPRGPESGAAYVPGPRFSVGSLTPSVSSEDSQSVKSDIDLETQAASTDQPPAASSTQSPVSDRMAMIKMISNASTGASVPSVESSEITPVLPNSENTGDTGVIAPQRINMTETVRASSAREERSGSDPPIPPPSSLQPDPCLQDARRRVRFDGAPEVLILEDRIITKFVRDEPSSQPRSLRIGVDDDITDGGIQGLIDMAQAS